MFKQVRRGLSRDTNLISIKKGEVFDGHDDFNDMFGDVTPDTSKDQNSQPVKLEANVDKLEVPNKLLIIQDKEESSCIDSSSSSESASLS